MVGSDRWGIFSFSSIADGGEGRDEEALIFPAQIPSPRPSPRLGGEREMAQIVPLPSGFILRLLTIIAAMKLI